MGSEELAINKNKIVAEVWGQMVSIQYWNLKFVRPCNNWEVDLVVQLLSALQKEKATPDRVDKVVWRASGDDFSVETYRRLHARVSTTPPPPFL